MVWKRAGRHTAFELFVMLVLASVGLGTVVFAIRQGCAVWAARDQKVHSGIASRSSPLITAAGKEGAAAWVGHIGRKEGKSRSFRAYCTIAKVDGLLVGQSVLHGWDTPGTVALRETPAGDELTTLDFERTAEGVSPPEAAKAACARISYPAESTYAEAMIPMGAPVEVSGCTSKDALAPCRNGADLVTVRSLRDRFAAARSAAIYAELFCIFFTTLPLGYLLFAVAGQRIMLTRRNKKRTVAP